MCIATGGLGEGVRVTTGGVFGGRDSGMRFESYCLDTLVMNMD